MTTPRKFLMTQIYLILMMTITMMEYQTHLRQHLLTSRLLRSVVLHNRRERLRHHFRFHQQLPTLSLRSQRHQRRVRRVRRALACQSHQRLRLAPALRRVQMQNHRTPTLFKRKQANKGVVPLPWVEAGL